MADIDYTGGVYSRFIDEDQAQAPARPLGDEAEPAGSGLRGAASVLGALVSLSLVVGVGVWGYKLVMRDVSGVPVVRALEGPMRVQPDDPGGMQADHQGLAVNEIAAGGPAAPAADRLVLAPRPVNLTDEDLPAGRIAVRPASITADEAAGAMAAASQQAAPSAPAAPAAPSAPDRGEIDALVASLTEGVPPLSDGAATPATGESATVAAAEGPVVQMQDEAIDPADLAAAMEQGAGLKKSLRPRARPARAPASGGDALSSAISAAVDTVASVEVDPATLPAGTRLAQLGAYDSADIARAEWVKLAARFEEYLGDKQRVIQKATSGGRTFYRLRAAGFADLNDARRFCSALVAENADCIPVTVR